MTFSGWGKSKIQFYYSAQNFAHTRSLISLFMRYTILYEKFSSTDFFPLRVGKLKSTSGGGSRHAKNGLMKVELELEEKFSAAAVDGEHVANIFRGNLYY